MNRAVMLRMAACAIMGLGAALLIAALLLWTYTTSRITKIPLDLDATLISEGNGTALDPASMNSQKLVVNHNIPLVSQQQIDVESPANADVVTLQVGTSVRRTDKQKDTGLLLALVDTVTLNRKTAMAVSDDTHPGGAVQKPRGFHDENPPTNIALPHDGLSYRFPFHTEKRTYLYFDPIAQKAFDANYSGEEDVNGLTTYRFTQDVGYDADGKLAEPIKYPSLYAGDEDSKVTASAAMWGVGGDPDEKITMTRYYAAQRTFWVDPESGTIVKEDEHANHYFARDPLKPELTVADYKVSSNEETIEAQVNAARGERDRLALWSRVLPISFTASGVIALIGGVLLGSFSLRTEAALLDPGLDNADHGFFGRSEPPVERVPGAEAETEKLPTPPKDLQRESGQPGASPPTPGSAQTPIHPTRVQPTGPNGRVRPVRRWALQWTRPGYALVLALLVVAPLMGPGYLLLRDAVSTPRSYLSDSALGLISAPRATPQDFAVALASRCVDGGIVVKALLVVGLWLAGWGAARLVAKVLPEAGASGQFVAITLAIWNPYVGERLLQGHWSLLLGYGCLPWVATTVLMLRSADAAERPGSTALFGLAFWIALAGLTPTGLILAATVGLVCVAAPGAGPPRWRCAVATLGCALLAALPWLTAAALGLSSMDRIWSRTPDVAAFAARAEPGLGTLGSLASLGGIWNGEAVPASRATLFAVVSAAALLAVVATGLPALVRRRAAVPLLVLATVSVLVPAASATGLGLAVLHAVINAVPGLGVLRDGQKWVALAMPGYALAGAAAVLTLRRWLVFWDPRCLRWCAAPHCCSHFPI